MLAVQGRAMPRPELAALLWGPGRLTNLRQELAALRRQPGAAVWLSVEDGWVTLRAETDLEQRPLPEGAVLEGLELPDAPAFEDWREQLSSTVEALRRPAAPPAPAEDIHAALADLLALADAPLRPEVLEQALGATPAQILLGERRLRAAGWLDDSGRWCGPPRPASATARRSLGLARWAVEGPSRSAAALLGAAGAAAEQTRLLLELAREGDQTSAEEAADAAPPALLGEALALAATLALRAENLPAFARHLQRLQTLARDQQAPALLLEVALLQVRQALVLRRDVQAADAAWQEAARLVRHHPELGATAADQLALWEGHLALALGAPDRATAALTRASEGTDPGPRASALAALGGLAASQGRTAEAAVLHEQALAATRVLRDRAAAGRMLNNLGATADRCGRLGDARQCFLDALALAEQLSDRTLQVQAALNLAEVERRLGALGETRRLLAACLSGGAALSPAHQALALQIRGDLELSCGRLAEAARWFGRAAEGWAALQQPAAVQMARWLEQLATTPATGLLHPAGWDALAEALPARADLAALCWEELLRRAPDAARAAHASRARAALLGPLSPPLAAVAAHLQGQPPPEDWRPGDTLDDALALALAGSPADALLARMVAGLLPAQAEALAARLAALRQSRQTS